MIGFIAPWNVIASRGSWLGAGLMLAPYIRADGAQVVVAGVGRNATIWDLETGRAIHSLAHATHGTSLAQYSPDGGTIVTVDLDRLVLRDSSGNFIATAETEGGYVDAVIFSRDGRRLATLDDQGSVKIWDATNLKLLLVLHDSGQRAIAVSFRPDERFIVTAHVDGRIRFWDPEVGALVYSLDAAAPRENAQSPWGLQTITFHPTKTWLFVGIGQTAALWDASDEVRSAEQVSRIVRCLSPWKIQGGKLVESSFDLAACR